MHYLITYRPIIYIYIMGMLEKKSVLIVLDRKDYFYLVLFF